MIESDERDWLPGAEGFKVAEKSNVEMLFQKYFGIPMSGYHDALMTETFGYVVVDLFKFDIWLHTQWGAYEKQKKSMRDVVIEHYGEEASKFICRLF